jgi:Tripartite tricarboxylate transporter TctB family
LKVRPQAIFSFIFLIFFIVFAYEAKDWRLQARLYPWAIAIPMVILAIIQVIFDLKGVEHKADDAAPVDFQLTQAVEPQVARKRAINIFSWFFGFFFGIWLLGFSLTIPLMVFGYLKIQSNEKWPISIILTAVAWVCFWGLFVKLLSLPFPDGMIQTWLGWT